MAEISTVKSDVKTAIDLNNVPNVNATDCDNHTSGTNNKVFTTAEQSQLALTTGTNTGDEPAASTTVAGISELATIAEVNTGTDSTRAITPSALAGSNLQTKADSAIQPPSFNAQAGTTYTMVASDENNIVELTGASACTFTLIEFSAVGQQVFINQEGNTSPVTGTLPTGMTIAAHYITAFEALTQGQTGAFICKDATPGSQIVKFI